ncbi:MAG TPA: FAD-dependent oxidoreductase [Fimbriiglobus sp.]|nr:FAD-dependent oxidoreductase [Fimbriiglobus sp.]
MAIPLLPGDPHDEALRANVKPPGWVNPAPAPRYQLVVLGAGPAGLVAAAGAAALGAKVALVERDLMGGDCLNVGCVPSKALLRAARAVAEVRRAREFGITVGEPQIDFAAVMERVRRVRAQISTYDSAERFRRMGVDVFLGEGKFVNEDTVEVNGAKLRFGRCVIATGARAAIPDIPGLRESRYFTNESVFTLTELPKRLLVIGAGPVGCELGQAFARLGPQVTLVARSGRLLPREDAEASDLLRVAFAADGVEIVHETPALAGFDAVLVATGRKPNVEGLNLLAAGIEVRDGHVRTDRRLRTTNPRVYAVGDVASAGPKFTHAADAMARLAVRNALFPGSGDVADIIPRCTYTDPEVAAVGPRPSPTDRLFRVGFEELDRAMTDGAAGFVKVAAHRGRLTSATVVGPHAGEIIGAVSLAMSNRLTLGQIASTVFPYPTYSEALKKITDRYNRTRLTPFRARVLKTWLNWFR